MRLFHHVLVYRGDLHLVHPALNLSTLNLKMMQQVSLMMFSLNMVACLLACPSCLKVIGWGGGGVVAHEI